MTSKTIFEAVEATAVILIGASFVAAAVGIYIAIWGDNAFGGRIVATALTTGVLMVGIGFVAAKASEE